MDGGAEGADRRRNECSRRVAVARRHGLKHRIGEDVSERLDVIPARLKVIVTRRPKYACRACAGEVSQAPAPERLIENGIPTEALVAHVLVAKYADHTPLSARPLTHTFWPRSARD